jgi:tetratricopeptide (TPR) repeat protein
MNDPCQREDVAANNESSLKALVRAIKLSQGQFRLILARCNYGALRDRMVQRLRELSPVEIRELVLPKSVKSLYTTIKAQLRDEVPQALMVFGLESVSDINAVLKSSNTIREEFSKNFPFPLVLWINDEVLQKLLRVAPDLESWATSVEFKLTTDELLDFLWQKTDKIFAGDSTLHLENCFELDAAWKDLQSRGQGLEPDLEARLEFVRGLDDFRCDRIDHALLHYQKSLAFWQQSKHLERQGVLFLNIGRCYYRKAELNRAESQQCWEQSRNYFQRCLNVFEQAQRPDLVAKHICQLGEVLRRLKVWDELKSLAAKALTLHQTHGGTRQLAQDYGFLAEVALEQSDWNEANRLAQKALQLLSRIPNWKPNDWALCTFLLARSQQHLEQVQEAIANLEQIRKKSNPQYDPQLYIDSLWELRSLYFQQGEYREAFQIKQEQFQIEHQYGFRAFIGAGYLQPKRNSVNPAVGEVEQEGTIAQEIAVSSREQDVKRLIERISRDDCKLTVIHGQSGVGKSSILQGGLVPALHQQAIGERDVLPILLRVYNDWVGALEMVLANAEFSPPSPPTLGGTGAQSPSTLGGTGVQSPPTLEGIGVQSPPTLGGTGVQSPPELGDLGGEKGQERIDSALHSPGLPPQPSSLKLRLLRGEQGERFEPASHSPCDPPQPPLLRGENSVKVPLFKGDLGGSLSAPILEQLRNNAKNNLLTVLIFDQFEEFFFVYSDQGKRRPFYEFLRVCLDIPFVKVILSLREDYLHYLLELDRLFDLTVINNNILDKGIRYYLGNFLPEDARSVVQSLTRNSQFPLETGLIEAFVQDLAGEVGEVRPIELQIVGMQLQTQKITTLEQYQQGWTKNKLVEGFLEEVIHDCGAENERAARLVLYLLTNENGTRPLKTRAELTAELAAEANPLDLVLEIFVKSGLVLLLPEKPEYLYQLVHDYLVEFIRQQQGAGLLAELQKEKEQRRLGEQRFNRFLKLALVGSFAAIVGLTGLTWQAVSQRREADNQRKQAEKLQLGQIDTLSRYSEELFNQDKAFDALLAGLQAGIPLRRVDEANVDNSTPVQVANALRQAVYGVRERNRLEGHDSRVRSVSFSPDGKTLASGSSDNTIKLWDVATGKPITTLKGHDSPVISVSFSPGGKTLASGSDDNTIKLWEVATGKPITTLTGHDSAVYSVSFSPDGKTLASGSWDNTIKLWEVATGKPITTLTGPTSLVISVSFSPDGKTLASGSSDNTIKVWNLATGKPITTLTGPTSLVISVSFSPDGKTLASASKDKTIKVWNFDLDNLLVRGCDWVRPYLKTNPNVSESDRTLCDDISTQK